MDLREIDFIKKFWSISGGYMLVSEFFWTMVNRQIQCIRKIQMSAGSSLPASQIRCCLASLHDLMSIENSLNNIINSPVVPDITSHINELFDDYETVFLHSSRKIIGLFADQASEYETLGTFLIKLADDPRIIMSCKTIAIELISHYIDYLELICKIIEKNSSQGRYIGLSRYSLYKVIVELHSILGKIQSSPLSINLTSIEARYSDQFYILIRRAHFLIETIVHHRNC